ncbi:hypothetical protein BCV70DRAFT_207441 [Testicularia cyperi]|uniref:Uncharacterized protein n=1 Tax=Testicularia cyperi TaxID=1882483 RepID=A0A317XLC1_9BASI|nr:hypothetical protein BCV70DRAFT_207441 [Testicularia cyperi]
MRHKRLLQSAGDAHALSADAICGRQCQAGPSRLPAPSPTPSAKPPPPLPPLPPPPPAIHRSARLSSTLQQQQHHQHLSHFHQQHHTQSKSPASQHSLGLERLSTHQSSTRSPTLTFLYPPSCFVPARRQPDMSKLPLQSQSSTTFIANNHARAQSLESSRPYSAHAHQLARIDSDRLDSDHTTQQPRFSFITNHHRSSSPPSPLRQPENLRSQQQSQSQSQSQSQPQPPPLLPLEFFSSLAEEEYHSVNASVSEDPADSSDLLRDISLQSLHDAIDRLQQQMKSLGKDHVNSGSEHAQVVRRVRKIVYMARHAGKADSRAAKQLARTAAVDCSKLLFARKDPISAASVLQHLLFHIGWDPRAESDSVQQSQLSVPLLSLPLDKGKARDASEERLESTSGAVVASSQPLSLTTISASSAKLITHAQELVFELSLHSVPESARRVRGFASRQHAVAARSLIASMRAARLPRSASVQTAVVRALLQSGSTLEAVRTYAVEVRAWWDCHKEALRPRLSTRRQAALVAAIGRPSSQAIRYIQSHMQRSADVISRVQIDLLSQLTEAERTVLITTMKDYAASLVVLCQLLRAARLPIPPSTQGPEISWIISACCRFEDTVSLAHPAVRRVPRELLHDKEHLQAAATTIRYFMREFMQSLPGGSSADSPHGVVLIGGEPLQRPPLEVLSYNQLIHYSMAVLGSPAVCKQVFQHMTHQRQPPLAPDAVTYNIILRQATSKRFEALARAVLSVDRPASASVQDITDKQTQSSGSSNKATRRGRHGDGIARRSLAQASQTSTLSRTRQGAATSNDAQPTQKLMIAQIDAAVARADPYRLVALIRYVTAASLFLPRFKHEPGYVGVKELVMRIFPSLHKHRYARRRGVRLASISAPASASDLDPDTMLDRNLRVKADRAARHAVLDPHVLTATLNLAAKAGKTGLALRIWRLLKRTSLQSTAKCKGSDVASKAWKIPVEAATVLMQILAAEARKSPGPLSARPDAGSQSRPVLPSTRSISPRQGSSSRATAVGMAARTRSLRRRRKNLARGWNVYAVGIRMGRGRTPRAGAGIRSRLSLRGGGGGGAEGLRWRVARVLAKKEYRFLMVHWGLSAQLSTHRQQQLMLWGQKRRVRTQPRKGAHKPALASVQDLEGEGATPKPDVKFFRAVLAIFGRGWPGRLPSPSSSLSMSSPFASADHATPKSRRSAIATATSTEDRRTPSHSLSDNVNAERPVAIQLSTLAAALDPTPVHGRSTGVRMDAFLLVVLLDLGALDIPIPSAYAWILSRAAAVSRSRVAKTARTKKTTLLHSDAE